MSGPSSDEPLASNRPHMLSSASQFLDPEPSPSPSLPTPRPTPSSILLPPHPLLSSRYHRQALLPCISIPGQTLISQSKVLIIGLGGLGSPASLYLAALGVHTLGLVDGDSVELSNLHRQVVHSEASVGESKVSSAMRMLKGLNSEVRVVGFEERFSASNAKRIVHEWRSDGGGEGSSADRNPRPNRDLARGANGGWDIVLDCTDNPATRYLISDACVLAGKVLVSGAAQRTEGQLMVLNCPPFQIPPDEEKKEMGTGMRSDCTNTETAGAKLVQENGPCYRCIFPVPPAPETVQSCAEVGVLGPVVGVVGVLMAVEVVKIIIRQRADSAGRAGDFDREAEKDKEKEKVAWKPSLLLYSALNPDPRSVWRSVGLRGRRRDCVACSDPPDEVALQEKERDRGESSSRMRITWSALADGRINYDDFCGTLPADVAVLDPEHRVAPGHFIETMEREEARDRVGRRNKSARPLVVDVRSEVEFALGPRVKGSVNVPVSKILRFGLAGRRGVKTDGGRGGGGGKGEGKGEGEDRDGDGDGDGDTDEEIEQLLGVGEATNNHPLYFVCQRGNDSQVAAQRLLDDGRLGPMRWVGDVRGGFVAFQRAGFV